MKESDSEFLRHISCGACGSSDANALYTDGHTHCHKCGVTRQPRQPKEGHEDFPSEPETRRRTRISGMIDDLSYQALGKRKLTEETCQKWGYGVGAHRGQKVQVANYRNTQGQLVAQKVRYPNKDFVILGDAQSMGLYGMHLWRDGGKKVVVTEGEIDALSVSQVQDLKWPVVSVPMGAQGAKRSIAKCLDWLEKFDEVVFMFDMDPPGQEAAKECAELLTPGKAKIASLPLKDANECLQANRGADIIRAMWDARLHRPDGIVAGVDLWERIVNFKVGWGVLFPWEPVNEMTRGMCDGEIVLVGAGTGVGKSEWVRQVVHYQMGITTDAVGYVALEESVEKTSVNLMGLEMGRMLHLGSSDPREKTKPLIETYSPDDLKRAYDATVGSGRFYLYDHWGSTDSDNLISKLRYMIKGLGCKTIVLDHISIVVSGIEEGDERRILDNTMTRLRSLVEETKCRLFLVAHLKSIEGKQHEEGGRVSLGHFRGSKAIVQLSDLVIGLERNMTDTSLSRYTRAVTLKHRRAGFLVGQSAYLEFDKETGRLLESEGPPGETSGQQSEDF